MIIGFIGFLEKEIIDFYINLCYNIIKKEKEVKNFLFGRKYYNSILISLLIL